MNARVRVAVTALAEGIVTLDRDAARYVERVRRLRSGDPFVLFDPQARIEADAMLLEASGTETRARVGRPRPATVVATHEVTVIQCVGKADKLDAVVRDATELGATRIAPAISSRSIAARQSDAALTRFRKIALEAARQSLRGDVPRVDAPRPLGEVLADCNAPLRITLDPSADRSVRAAIEAVPRDAAAVVLIGPEGGLSGEELDQSERAGFTRATLGPIVLRTETVCAAMLGALLVMRQRADSES